MKSIWSLLLFSVLTLTAQAQETEGFIKKHLEAIGGEKNWDKIHTVKVEGVLQMEGVQIKTTKQVIKNKAWRNDMLFEGKTQSLTNNKYFVSVFEQSGWKYLPDSKDNKPESLSAGEVALYKEDMDFEDPFVHYQEKGTRITFLSKENILETDYLKFAFTFKSGKQEYIYLRESDMMIAKRVLYNSDAEDTKEYLTYEKQAIGIYYPMLIKTSLGDIYIQKVNINPALEEKLFQVLLEKK